MNQQTELSIDWEDPRKYKGPCVMNPLSSVSLDLQKPLDLTQFTTGAELCSHSDSDDETKTTNSIRGWVIFALADWCGHCKREGIELFTQSQQVIPALLGCPVSWMKSDKFECITPDKSFHELVKMKSMLKFWPSIFFLKSQSSSSSSSNELKIELYNGQSTLVDIFEAFSDFLKAK